MKYSITSVKGTKNTGHGHIFKRPDGNVARCGGPKFCRECAKDLVALQTSLAKDNAVSKTTTITAKKDPENPVPYGVLEQAIVDIGKGMKALDESRLKRESLVVLLADQTRVAKTTIRHVLNALSDLERAHLKPALK